MSGRGFLTHNQLHEDLFSFLPSEDILNLRCVAATCDSLVVTFAKVQVQDVLGQDLMKPSESSIRTLDPHLLQLLVIRGDDIGQVINAAGPQGSGARPLWRASPALGKTRKRLLRCSSGFEKTKEENRLTREETTRREQKTHVTLGYR